MYSTYCLQYLLPIVKPSVHHSWPWLYRDYKTPVPIQTNLAPSSAYCYTVSEISSVCIRRIW